MEQTIFSMTLVLALGLSLYGWGRLALGVALPEYRRYGAFMVAIGMVVTIFFGGLLNAIHLAFDWAIDTLLIIGWFLCTMFAIIAIGKRSFIDRNVIEKYAPTFAVLSLILVFLAATLIPSRSVNIWDDFYSYLVVPVRMLQTGSLAGNPFDGSGLPAHGPQAFMQAVFLAHLPLGYISAFDSVFCLLLSAALLLDIGNHVKAPRSVQLLAITSLIVFNPQIVNITAVYSAVALMLACILATSLQRSTKGHFTLLPWFTIGAIYGTLVCFKSTYFLWAASALLIHVLWSARTDRGLRRGLSQFAAMTCGIVAVTIPWLVTYIGDYEILFKISDNPASIDPPRIEVSEFGLVDIFSKAAAGAGGKFWEYGAALAVILLIGAIAVWRAQRIGNSEPTIELDIFATATATLVAFAGYGAFGDLDLALRFSAPAMISTLAVASFLSTSTKHGTIRSFLGSAAVTAVTIILFGQTFMQRIDWALGTRSFLYFESAHETPYLPYVSAALEGKYDSWIQGTQQRLPPAAGILTWHPLAFLMDFRRNPIMTFNEQGYNNPLYAFPPAGGYEATTDLLRSIGIRYIVWEYLNIQFATWTTLMWPISRNSGIALYRKQTQSQLRFRDYLNFLAEHGYAISDDKRIAVFDLEQPGR